MYKFSFIAVILFFSYASSSFFQLDPRQNDGSPNFICNNGTAVIQACSIDFNAKKCRALWCTPKCETVYGCITHAFSSTQTAKPITIAPSCQAFAYGYASCNSKTYGFATLEPSQKASCLCYRTDGAWDPAAWDSALSSCYAWNQRFLKTAPPAVKSFLTTDSYLVSVVASESAALKSYLSLVSSYTAHHPSLSVNSLSPCIIYGNVRGAKKTVMTTTGDTIPTITPTLPGMGTIKHSIPRQTPKPTFASIHSGPMPSKTAAAMATALPRKDMKILGAFFVGLVAFF